MCGRFNIISDPLIQLLGEITGLDYPLVDRFNIAPTEQVPVITRNEASWGIREMRWWLIPRWTKEPSSRYTMFNARSENLAKSKAYQRSFRDRRCVIPASGYYEWRQESGRKIPYWVRPTHESGFLFAGLWDRWHGNNEPIESCTVVTAAADPRIGSLHPRMPVSLSKEDVAAWLSEDYDETTLQALCHPQLACPVEVVPVSTYVNNSKNKGEQCVAITGPIQQVG